jgi:hypothetical protein
MDVMTWLEMPPHGRRYCFDNPADEEATGYSTYQTRRARRGATDLAAFMSLDIVAGTPVV